MKQKPFVLLYHEGTIIKEWHYLSDPQQVELLVVAAAGLRQMHELGLGAIAVTNQSDISRGFFDEKRLGEIHQRMLELLAAESVF